MYAIFQKIPQNVSSYNRSTHGWVFNDTCEDLQDFKNKMLNWEDANTFEQEDGLILDQNGSEVYDPDYPTYFEFGDYDYICEKVDDLSESLDEDKIKAIENANPWNLEAIKKEMNS